MLSVANCFLLVCEDFDHPCVKSTHIRVKFVVLGLHLIRVQCIREPSILIRAQCLQTSAIPWSRNLALISNILSVWCGEYADLALVLQPRTRSPLCMVHETLASLSLNISLCFALLLAYGFVFRHIKSRLGGGWAGWRKGGDVNIVSYNVIPLV
jgi:hypothetical protein